jgi:hypothetical protein
MLRRSSGWNSGGVKQLDDDRIRRRRSEKFLLMRQELEGWVRTIAERNGGADAQNLREHVLELPIRRDVGPSRAEYIADHVLRLNLQHAS